MRKPSKWNSLSFPTTTLLYNSRVHAHNIVNKEKRAQYHYYKCPRGYTRSIISRVFSAISPSNLVRKWLRKSEVCLSRSTQSVWTGGLIPVDIIHLFVLPKSCVAAAFMKYMPQYIHFRLVSWSSSHKQGKFRVIKLILPSFPYTSFFNNHTK